MQDSVLDAWQVAKPRWLRPLAHGTNNRVWRVDTPDGAYVLRVYGNHADPERLRFEHAVLIWLGAMGLPFAVPAPLPVAADALYTRETTEDGEILVTLTRLIAGIPPVRNDLGQARAAGEALGLLDRALAQIGQEDATWGVSWRTSADLARCHPLVPDPEEALATLPVDEETRGRLLWRYAWLRERMPGMYAELPQQLVHEDYDPSNVLMDGAIVRGMLDFEFCSRDLRVMDLCVALSWWPVERFGTGEEWPIVGALAKGYGQEAALTRAEVEALPALLSLRAYTSLIHRIGRYRQGISPLEAVTSRAYAAIERERWLRMNGEQLAQTVGEALVG